MSYSHEDAEAVFKELKWMRSSGFNIWYDEGISPGHSWPEELAKSIEHCALFVLFVTPKSVQSRNCLREINYAIGKDKEILAIYLTETDLPSGLALEISDRQAIIKSKFSLADYHSKLQEALSDLVTTIPETSIQRQSGPEREQETSRSSKTAVVGIAIVLVVAVVVGVWWQNQSSKDQQRQSFQSWEEAVSNEDTIAAHKLASNLELSLEQLNKFSREGEMITEPPGARIEISTYTSGSDDWVVMGTTPLKTRWPLGGMRVRISKVGFRDLKFLLDNPSPTIRNRFTEFFRANNMAVPAAKVPLVPAEKYPSDMVYVPLSKFVPMVTSFGVGPKAMIETGAFLIDKFEVTNRQYKEFVDARGYAREQFWRDMEFKSDGNNLTFKEALALFIDSTGQTGPATWESGTYPIGQEDYPVSGVSWYEASAYAKYADKKLPAAAYWAHAAYTSYGGGIGVERLSSYIVPSSNFANSGSEKVSNLKGLGAYGTYGQAGNVREWVSNSAGDKNWILGGAANDEPYMSTLAYVRRPIDRSAGNGFRLIRYIDEPNEQLLADRPLLGRSPDDYIPVSDDVFATFREQFQYDHSNLDPTSENVDDSHAGWTHETVSLRTGYDDSRFKVHVLKPKGAVKNETLVFFPGAGTYGGTSPFESELVMQSLDYIVNSGRILVIPELFEGYSRSSGKYLTADMSIDFRDWIMNWHSDVGRTLDFLQSDPDQFGRKFTYYGVSYGACQQLPLLAMEDRFSNAVLVVGGIAQNKASLSLLDQLNYVPRITIPVLFIGARFDNVFPIKHSQQPFLDLLGTPKDKVKRVMFDGSHQAPPRKLLIKEVINWQNAHG